MLLFPLIKLENSIYKVTIFKVVLAIGDHISTSLSTIPRLENNYFRDDHEVQKDTLDTALPHHVTDPYYSQITNRLKELFVGPLGEQKVLKKLQRHTKITKFHNFFC